VLNHRAAKLLTLPAALAVALFAATAAIAQSGAPSGAGSDKVSDQIVKIGLILDLYGPYADTTGVGSTAAARMAVEDFDGKVLGMPIEVVVADHGDNSDRAAAIARDWFDRKQVDAVMEVSGSSQALVVQAIARTRDKIVSFSAPGALRLTNEACSPTAVQYVSNTYAVAHALAPPIVKRGGNSWFFVTVDYSYGYDLENNTATIVTEAGGKVLGHARHPLNAPDFAPYLAQARQSGAKVIALANAGGDTLNAIKQAAKLHMIPGNQTLTAMSLRVNVVDALGLDAAQGMMLVSSFYWDRNEASRAWSKRYYERVNKMPNDLQAGVYSSVTHYLKAVASAGTDATEPVMAAMRAAPINDFFADNGKIRADGSMVHDMYLFEVKKPSESRYPWDYFRLVATVPGDQAFPPLAQSKCPLVRK